MMKIGCGTVCFRNLPLEDALRRISRAGYKWVETQATAPFCPHVDPRHDDPEAFVRLVADCGFEGVTGQFSLTRIQSQASRPPWNGPPRREFL